MIYMKFCLITLLISICTCFHNGDFHNEAHITEKTKITTTSDVLQNLQNKEVESKCPTAVPCEKLDHRCISCSMNESCVYGKPTTAKCRALVNCIGTNDFEKSFICQYCYQTEKWEHTCVKKANCNSVSSPRSYYRTNCSVHDDVMCLGRRMFVRNVPCNWTGGHRWSTAMLLSITLGGFGADRFYLGYWQEGIGKLFSFGGLGVWTIIDFILISIQYLGPADGSLYI